MTIIYAEKHDDLIFVLADTYWEIPAHGLTKNWAMEPISKIVTIDNKVTIAFANRIDLAEEAISSVKARNCVDAVDVLLKAHLASKGQVDFLVVEHTSFSLTKISGGTASQVSNCHLGSHEAFVEFQRLRLSKSEERKPEGIGLGIVRLVDGTSELTGKRYSNAFMCFQECLMKNGGSKIDWGGFVVPWCLSREVSSYGSYLKNMRAPLDPIEIPRSGFVDVPHNDIFFGGYQLVFSGSQQGFSAHFVNGNFGFIYSGFESQRLAMSKYLAVNPYDFGVASEKIQCSPIGTWRSPFLDTVQLLEYAASGRADGISYLLKLGEADLIGHIGGNVDLSSGLLAALNSLGTIDIRLETLSLITFVLQARLELANLSGTQREKRIAFEEWSLWQGEWARMRAKINFSFPAMI